MDVSTSSQISTPANGLWPSTPQSGAASPAWPGQPAQPTPCWTGQPNTPCWTGTQPVTTSVGAPSSFPGPAPVTTAAPAQVAAPAPVQPCWQGTQCQPPQYQPPQYQPPQYQPAQYQPPQYQPAQYQPPQYQPPQPQPALYQPAQYQPLQPQPAQYQPTQPQPAQYQPLQPQPAQYQPLQPQPAQYQPLQPQPALPPAPIPVQAPAPTPAPTLTPHPVPGPAPGTSSRPNVQLWPGHPGWPYNPGQSGWPGQNPAVLPPHWLPPTSGPLSVPYNLNLARGVYDKMMMTILGHVKPNAKMFTVNFLRGNDIAFHINPRFSEGGKQVLVRNHKLGERWGAEERDLKGPFPFALGSPFEMKILCTQETFRVAVNNIPLFEFRHRVRELNQVDRINILHDVVLTCVNVETLA
uniref:galectin-3 isoform X2 n=1 Tax=Gasterosteus aculeatus aculeatus TaxID=481459 RepID=UPI001A9A0D0F|nr:galectin-3 isoform X2 [Gasterosteus aculeatus aculeatus]